MKRFIIKHWHENKLKKKLLPMTLQNFFYWRLRCWVAVKLIVFAWYSQGIPVDALVVNSWNNNVDINIVINLPTNVISTLISFVWFLPLHLITFSVRTTFIPGFLIPATVPSPVLILPQRQYDDYSLFNKYLWIDEDVAAWVLRASRRTDPREREWKRPGQANLRRQWRIFSR